MSRWCHAARWVALWLACSAGDAAAQDSTKAKPDSSRRLERPAKKDDHTLPAGTAAGGDKESLTVGGYVKLDVIQDVSGSIGNRSQFKTATIAVDGTPQAAQEGGTTLTARESRVNADFRLRGRMRAFVEGDFYGDNGAFRLRHAYGELGHLLAGQTWTTFMDISARPLTLDFEGPDSEVFLRQALIRWTQPVSKAATIRVAAENPSPEIAVPSGDTGVIRSGIPDFVGTVRLESGFGHVQVAALVRQLRFDGEDVSPDMSTTGWGVNATLVVHTVGKDELFGQLMYGEGAAHYVDAVQGQNLDAIVVGGELRALPITTAVVGYTHHWSSRARSGAAYSLTSFDNDPSQAGSSIHRLDDVRVNLFYLPHPHVDVATELLWGRRRNANGDKGEAWRLQFGVIYHFGFKLIS